MNKCKMKETVIDGITVKDKDCPNCEHRQECESEADQAQAEYLCAEEIAQAEAEEIARQETEAEASEEYWEQHSF